MVDYVVVPDPTLSVHVPLGNRGLGGLVNGVPLAEAQGRNPWTFAALFEHVPFLIEPVRTR